MLHTNTIHIPPKYDDVADINHEPKKQCEKGLWVAKSFRISCLTDQGLSKQTYIRAAVGSQQMGGDDCFGSFLHISNKSSRYPAYFGVNGRLTDKVDPKQSKTIQIADSQAKDKIKISVTANILVKFWDDQSRTRAEQ